MNLKWDQLCNLFLINGHFFSSFLGKCYWRRQSYLRWKILKCTFLFLFCGSVQRGDANRPLPSSKNPHFQNEARCTTFLVKMRFICMRMKNDFRIKGWAPTIALKQRPKGTQKWPILNLKSKAWPFKYKREGILFSATIYTVCYVRKRTYFSPTVSWVVLIFPVVMIVVLKYSTMIHNKGYWLSANTV